ncbi:hypothetical protein Tco_0277444 [Tanacetum coccineum]
MFVQASGWFAFKGSFSRFVRKRKAFRSFGVEWIIKRVKIGGKDMLPVMSIRRVKHIPYGRIRLVVGIGSRHLILCQRSKSDGLTFNGTVYHDTFQFKKSTNIVRSRKDLTELSKSESYEFMLNHKGDEKIAIFIANICEETLDVVGFVVGLINNTTFVNIAIFNGFIEFGNGRGDAGDFGCFWDVGFRLVLSTLVSPQLECFRPRGLRIIQSFSESSDEEDDDEVGLNDNNGDNDDDEDNDDDDDDDVDNQDDDDQEDDGQDDEDQDDVNEQTDSDNDGDDFVHPKHSTQDQEGCECHSGKDEILNCQMLKQNNVLNSQVIEISLVYFILAIVDAYIANHELMKPSKSCSFTVKQTRDEAQADNESFSNKLNDNIKKIIKDQVKEQVKAQVSKILPKLRRLSDEQKNLYKALVDAYESDKLILDTYEDNVSFKRCRDDEDKDEEPPAGSNWGSKRRRAGKEPESTSAPKEKTSKITSKSIEGSKNLSKSAGEYCSRNQPDEETSQLPDWFQKPAKPPTLDLEHIQLQWRRQRLQITGIANGLKIWESARDVYSKRRIIAVTKLQIVEWHNYKHLDWITVCRDDDKLYKFKEGDFKGFASKTSKTCCFFLCVSSKACGKILQLGVEELPEEAQPLRKPTTLDDRLKGIRMKYLPQTIWRQSDRDKAGAMIQEIDKKLKTLRFYAGAWRNLLGGVKPSVMSSASSVITYTSVYTDSKPGRIFWGADEEISDGVPQDEDEREPMFIQPHDPDYVPEPIYPEYIPLEDEHEFLVEEQPLPPVDLPITESPGYVAESDPEEDPGEYKDDETKDGPIDYPMDGGEDGDDDDGGSHRDDADDEDEDEEDEDEEDEEEEVEHLALANSVVVISTVELVSPPEGTDPVIPPPSTDITTIGARITVRI